MLPPERSTRSKASFADEAAEDAPEVGTSQNASSTAKSKGRANNKGKSKGKRKGTSGPKKSKTKKATVEEEETWEDEADPPPPCSLPEVPLPEGALPIPLSGRDPLWPSLYYIKSHPLVPPDSRYPDRRIVLMVVDCRKEALSYLFRHAAGLTPPKNRREAEKFGYHLLRPRHDDRVILMSKYGPHKDKLVSWALPKSELTAKRVAQLKKLQQDVLGEQEKMSASKPTVQDDGTYVGGIPIERHDRAKNLPNGPRCYSLSISLQVPKRMSAPGVQTKVFSAVKDDDAQMRFDLLHQGATLSAQGMKKAGPEFVKMLERQAIFTNLPRVGCDDNFTHPAFQINVATAREPTEVAGTGIGALGRFGTSHIDSGDSVGAPTSMTIFSEEYEGVEEEIFFIVDYGLGWIMEEFSTLFFSGLHFHGGCQPTYKAERENPDHIYYRLTLIAYPPSEVVSGSDTVAFATLPNKKLLPIGYELRNPATSHILGARVQTTQATYTGDGSALFEPMSQLRHFVWGLVELTISLVRQLDPCLLVRFDVDKFVDSFSCVIDGVRVGAPPWLLGPGWRGKDVEIGRKYDEILKQLGVKSLRELAETSELEETLAKLWNSDEYLSKHPFNNAEYSSVMKEWKEHIKHQSEGVPLLAEVSNSKSVLGGRLGGLIRGLVKRTRKPRGKGEKPQKKSAVVEVLQVDGESAVQKPDDGSSKRTKSSGLPIESIPAVQKPDDGARKRTRSSADGVDDAQPSDDTSDARMRKRLRSSVEQPASGHTSEQQMDVDLPDNSSDVESEDPAFSREEFHEDRGSEMDVDQHPVTPQQIVKVLEFEPYFLDGFTEANLQACLSSLESHAQANVDAAWSSAQAAVLTIKTSSTLWRCSARICASHIRRASQSVFDLQARVLALEILVFDAMDHHITSQWPFAADGARSNPSQPVAELLYAVRRCLSTRPGIHELDASDFFTDFVPKECVKKFVFKQRSLALPTAAEVYTTTMGILCEWFDFPDRALLCTRAWFLLEIVRRFGPHILRFQFVQHAAYNFNVAVLGIGKNRRITRDDVITWANDHLPAVMASRGGLLLLKRLSDVSSISTTAVDMGLFQELANASNKSVVVLGEPYNLPSLPPILPISNAISSSYSPSSLTFDRKQMNRLVLLVKAALPLLRDHKATSSATNSVEKRLHNAMLQVFKINLDHRLPFRNHAPSRQRVLQDPGPYTPGISTSKRGLFGALIYRGITHNTPFLLGSDTAKFEGTTLFDDFQHYRTVKEEACKGQPDEYFCRMNAYGSPAKSRVEANSESFWELVNNSQFCSFLTASPRWSFTKLYKYIKKEAFSFGPLIAAQFAIDQVQCGNVDPPTWEEMAEFILPTASLGGHRGLLKLGFKFSTVQEVAEALRTVHREVSAAVPVQYHEEIGLDVIFVEHLLCKFHRTGQWGARVDKYFEFFEGSTS